MGAADGFVLAVAVVGLLEGVFSGWDFGKGGVKGFAWRLTWCISTVTVPPAFTGHFPATARAPVLQTKSLLPTLVRGEFEPGMRTHEEPCWECQSAMASRRQRRALI